MLAGAPGGVSGCPVGEGLNAGKTEAIGRVGGEKRDSHLLPAGVRSLGGGLLLANLNYEIRIRACGAGVAGTRPRVRLVCDCAVS